MSIVSVSCVCRLLLLLFFLLLLSLYQGRFFFPLVLLLYIIFYTPARRELKYSFMITAAAVHRREETETATSRLCI